MYARVIFAASLTAHAMLLAACGTHAPAADASGDAMSLPGDADVSGQDGPRVDAAFPIADATAPPPDAVAPDTALPDGRIGPIEDHVHIYIDNFCNTSSSPTNYTVAPGDTLRLTYHNHSVDYDADVWLSYGGGYLDLITGGTWPDQFVFCTGPGSYTAYADISIAGGGGNGCPGVRLYITCQ